MTSEVIRASAPDADKDLIAAICVSLSGLVLSLAVLLTVGFDPSAWM